MFPVIKLITIDTLPYWIFRNGGKFRNGENPQSLDGFSNGNSSHLVPQIRADFILVPQISCQGEGIMAEADGMMVPPPPPGGQGQVISPGEMVDAHNLGRSTYYKPGIELILGTHIAHNLRDIYNITD